MEERKKKRAHERKGREMRIRINRKLLLIVKNVRASAIETYKKKGERNRRKRKKRERRKKNEKPNSLISDVRMLCEERTRRGYKHRRG